MTSIHRLALSCAAAAALAAFAPTTPPAAGRCGEPTQRPWCNTSLGPDQRVAPGCYGVMVGSSSRSLPLQGSTCRG